MTDTLRALLDERAAAVRFEPVDLDAVTRAGTRAVRRRRWTGAALAAVTVTVVAALATTPWGADRSDAPVAPSPRVDGVTYVTGGTLHTASGDIELGDDASAYVRTAFGFVVLVGSDVYRPVNGGMQLVGEAAERGFSSSFPRLFGDTDGSLAAWPDGPQWVVLDTESGSLTRIARQGPGSILAVDAGTLYVVDDRGVLAVDVQSGDRTQLGNAASHLGYEATFEDDRIAIRSGNGNLFVPATGPGDRAPTVLPQSRGFDVIFSPDARHLVVTVPQVDGADRVKVYDVDSGFQVVLPTGSGDARGYEWLDSDTVAVLSLETPGAHYRLLACTVTEPHCDVAVPDLGEGAPEGDDDAGFTLPIGWPLGS